jgi:hypothetical protein
MKRTTLTASLISSAAAGLIAAAIVSPAWAQATTYPQGTDCSAIQNATNREDCMTQMNESRQNQIPGTTTQPQGNAPATGAPSTLTPATPNNAPGGATGTSGGAGGTNGSGTTGTGTSQ